MSVNCTCPVCRHRRGELSDREFAWYLKGCIEVASLVPKSVIDHCRSDAATVQERKFEETIWDEKNGSSIMLCQLVEKMTKDGLPNEPAFNHPESYTLRNQIDGNPK